MIKIENFVGPSPEQFLAVTRGMRNPMNSWGRLDSSAGGGKDGFHLGENDEKLAKRLCAAGPEHRKFLRQLPVVMDITAPLYWWKQMDQYKVGTATDSCSTMHRLTERPFEFEDFSLEENDGEDFLPREAFGPILLNLNVLRDIYLNMNDIRYWYVLNEFLPQSYNQKRTWSGNYEVLRTICRQRQGHKLKEWAGFIEWARDNVPYAEELIFDEGNKG